MPPRPPRPPKPPIPPVTDPPLLPDPPASTGETFVWRPRVQAPDLNGNKPVEYAKIPYHRELKVSAGSPLGTTIPGWEDDDRDSYLRTQSHMDDSLGNHIARAVFAGGYGTNLASIMLDDNFSDHTLHWYNCEKYDGEGTEGNDIPIRPSLGSLPGAHQKLQFRLVHRPTGTVGELRDYGALFTDPNIVVNLMAPLPVPFKDTGRAVDDNGNLISPAHDVYSRQKMVIWYKVNGVPREAHAAYYDTLHPDWYYKVTVTGTTSLAVEETDIFTQEADTTAPTK